jgi:hypothetical protein
MTTLHIALPPDLRPFGGADVLVYYDGPQLFWLPCPDRRLLAFGLPNGGRWPFLVVELTDDQAAAVESNQLTLRAACLAAAAKWLMPDYDAADLMLEPLAALPDDWLPGDVTLAPVPEASCQ